MQQVAVKTQNHTERSHPDPDSPIDIILLSHAFERTPVLKGLLVYLWKHREEEFSEYAIATDALGRRPDFDPKGDATVRVEISRLRQRLKEFYETEGVTARVRVRIPMGSHHLEVFHAETPALASEGADIGLRSGRGIWSRLLLVVVGCCITLVVVAAYLKLQSTHNRLTAAPTKVEPLPRFWQSFLANGKPSHIIIPRPTFFSWGSDLIVRDTYVNDFSMWKNSPNLAGMQKRFGSPSLMQTYTVADDAFGALRLVSFLQAHAISTTATTSEDASPDRQVSENFVALGTSKTLNEFDQSVGLIPSLDFRLAPGERSVENLRPAKGEPQKFTYRSNAEAMTTWPGILAVLPGKGPNTHLMILKASHTLGMAIFLTSPAGLNQLEKMWEAHGSPPYFEAVVNIEMSGDQYSQSWPVALHPWQGPR
ncbi:MAG: helix-turn-helix domain-containing protein [Acidobacteriota bacterium]|nr:helix-turn-helix domain-containing protein [Acidobacteriota bacterium]